jgi:hypothetical protein
MHGVSDIKNVQLGLKDAVYPNPTLTEDKVWWSVEHVPSFRNKTLKMRFDVVMAVIMKVAVLKDMMPCSLIPPPEDGSTGSSETEVHFYHTLWHHIWEESKT